MGGMYDAGTQIAVAARITVAGAPLVARAPSLARAPPSATRASFARCSFSPSSLEPRWSGTKACLLPPLEHPGMPTCSPAPPHETLRRQKQTSADAPDARRHAPVTRRHATTLDSGDKAPEARRSRAKPCNYNIACSFRNSCSNSGFLCLNPILAIFCHCSRTSLANDHPLFVQLRFVSLQTTSCPIHI